MKKSISRHLTVSKPNTANELVQIGVLDFDESNRASLSTVSQGPAAEELKKAWEEISKQKELIWKQSRPDKIDGRSVTRVVGEKVSPGDETYIYAVLNVLERKYGYTVDIVEP